MAKENKNVVNGETKEKKGTGKKVFKAILRVLFNIFWVITGGIPLALTCISLGISTFVMIIPIFFGIPFVFFKIVPLVFAPAGKKVKLHFGKAPVRNVFYWILGGEIAALLIYLLGAVLCCTLILIPIGLQMFKFGKYFLAPFRAEVTKDGKNMIKEKEDKKAKKQEGQTASPAQVAAAPAHDPLDDLEKLKTLLDKGVISQEEFDKKKAEILKL